MAPQALQPTEQDSGELRDHVIIAGFGRVGQIIAQLLSERLIPYVALDVSAERVQVPSPDTCHASQHALIRFAQTLLGSERVSRRHVWHACCQKVSPLCMLKAGDNMGNLEGHLMPGGIYSDELTSDNFAGGQGAGPAGALWCPVIHFTAGCAHQDEWTRM